MTTKIIPIRGLSRPQGTMDFLGDELGPYTANMDSYNETVSFVDLRLSANDVYIIAAFQSDNTLRAAPWLDGADPEWGTGFDVSTDAPWVRPHPTDSTLFLSISTGNTSDVVVYQIDKTDYSISVVDTYTATPTPGILFSGTWANWNADGTRVAVGSSSRLYLFSWNGAALSLLDDIAIFSGDDDRCQPHFVPEQEQIFCGGNGDNRMYLISYSGDTLSITDTTTLTGSTEVAFGRSCVSPDGAWGVNSGRVGFGNCSIIGINTDGTFGTQTTFPEDFNEAVWIGNDRIVTIEDDAAGNMPVRVYSWDGSTLTKLDEKSGVVGNAQRAHITSTKPVPPPTPEQHFNTTYADVSGRDPLPTALNQRTPARSLANYNISMYLLNPQIIRKPVQISLGELHLTNPAPDGYDIARLMWFDADDRDPHFVIGRWAQVIGRSGTADPGIVELELRICDNPESFIEPTP